MHTQGKDDAEGEVIRLLSGANSQGQQAKGGKAGAAGGPGATGPYAVPGAGGMPQVLLGMGDERRLQQAADDVQRALAAGRRQEALKVGACVSVAG